MLSSTHVSGSSAGLVDGLESEPNLTLNEQVVNDSVTDVVIIGAGPYALSIACYLKAYGVQFRIFGSPMRFWRDMAKGSALKSFDFATNIYSPVPGYGFVDFCRTRGLATAQPIPMSQFAAYGMWVQQELVPNVKDVEVCFLRRTEAGYRVSLASGEQVNAARVIVAIGLTYLQESTKELAALSPSVLTHTYERPDYDALAHKDVTVIGAGQSAIEAAAFIQESGATTRLLARSSEIVFSSKWIEPRPLLTRLRRPQNVLGAGWKGRLLQSTKRLFHFVPEKRRVHITQTFVGPAATWWLRDKFEDNVSIHLRTHVLHAAERDGRVTLKVRDEQGEREIVTDHVVAGTGYTYAVDRIPFLDREIVDSMAKIEQAPKLSVNFESSVPGLYFVGPIAAYSFGPLLRFISGAEFAAPAIARHLAKSRVK